MTFHKNLVLSKAFDSTVHSKEHVIFSRAGYAVRAMPNRYDLWRLGHTNIVDSTDAAYSQGRSPLR